MLADHGRAMTFLAADGVVPGNEGRDYVLRRIIRRAVSEAGHLGLEPGAVADLAGPVVEGWGEAYPELAERAAHVRDVLGAEAEQFARTLSQGRRLLSEVIDRSGGAGDGVRRGRLPPLRHLRLPARPHPRGGPRRGPGPSTRAASRR